MVAKLTLNWLQLLIFASSALFAAPLAVLADDTTNDIHVVKNPQCGCVPASDIKRLIEERPDALGLAVPAMPYGSPGMGPEEKREAYDVFIIMANGTAEVFQHYPQAGIPV